MTGGELIGPKGRPFTPEQADAIRRRTGSLLLSAAAGSGKTSVLVERFVRAVLEDGIEPSRILAITFTDKAAAELRARIRERFAELGERTAARATEGAFVSTIHGFCSRVLRAHPIAGGIDPRYSVLEDTDARLLSARAFDESLAARLAGEGDGGALLDLAAAYGHAGLSTMVRGAHDLLRSRGQTTPVLPPAPAAPPADGDALARARDAAAAELAAAEPIPTVSAALAALERCRELLDDLGPGEVPEPWRLDTLGFRGGAKALKTEAALGYLDAIDAYRSACAAHHTAQTVALLGELVQAYGQRYAELKREASALDFEDLQLLARDLLERSPELRSAWAERFEMVMVDEFQDTNPLQLSLVRLLARDNLFVVGDDLQSIYRFRHADVGVFRSLREELGLERTASLTVNFRSRAAVLDAVNAAFAPQFGDGFDPLVEGRDPEPRPAPARVELLLTDTSKPAEGDPGWDALDLGALPAGAAWRRAEARLLAQRVRELVDSGEAEEGRTVVLLRASGDAPTFERALADQGLSTYITAGRGYWVVAQVQDLTAYLAALANPRDEPALYRVLASPLAGVSADGLAVLARSARAQGTRPWHALEAAFCDGGDGSAGLAGALTSADRERLAAFCPRFAAERASAPRRGLDELLERAIEASGYDLAVLALPDGERALANVRKLLRLVRSWEARHGRDLRGIVSFLAEQAELQGRDREAALESESAIRLMTIHDAKGLEFDTVCLADLGRREGNGLPSLLLAADGSLGLRLSTLGQAEPVKALDWEAIAKAEAEADRREEQRIHYVGMTRARERLLLSGSVSCSRWPGAQGSAIAWLAPALVPDIATRLSPEHPVIEVEREWDGRATTIRAVLNAPATVGAVLAHDALDPRGVAPVAAAEPALPEPARPSEPAAPPGAAGPRVPVGSLSYSSLAAYARCPYRWYLQHGLGLPDVEPGPESEPEPPKARDGLLVGTVVHLALEALDFDRRVAPDAAALSEIAMREGGALPAARAEQVAASLAAFLRSPVAERLAASGDVLREHPFAFLLDPDPGSSSEPVLVTGVLDALARESGRSLVVDYKSDRVGAADLEALVDGRYGVQRRIYALAALLAGAEEVEVVYAFIERPGEPVGRVYGRGDRAALEGELRGLAAGLLTGRFEPASDPHLDLCRSCPGRRGLCSHPPEMTDRPRPGAAPSGP